MSPRIVEFLVGLKPEVTNIMHDEPILVLPAREDAERDAVAQAWSMRGWSVCRLNRFWEPPALPRERVRLYGDMTFCLVLAQKLNLELVSPPDDLLLRVEPTWLKRRVECVRLDDACGREFPMFVKPLVPKLFGAGVFPNDALLARHTEGFAPETSVLVSEPVEFRCEVRCLVLDGNVISAATYEGKGYTQHARDYARSFVSSCPIPRTLAVDVGWIRGRGWAVIEANAVWGAGLNGCDPEKMADCIAVATRANEHFIVADT